MSNGSRIRKLALVVGGGPAPGINGVISAVTLEALNHGIEVYGIRDGYKRIVTRDMTCIEPLTREKMRGLHTRGGSYLGTARTNPTKKPEDMQALVDIFKQQGFDALVSIGGDDTAFSASQVYKTFNGAVKVAHVPKTIDNDLPLPGSTPTFGFETARQVGVSLVRNLYEDARTTSRWYLIVSMGRAAGHLALGIGKAAAATLTIIPEEFNGKEITLDHLCDIIVGSIVKRVAEGQRYGLVVLAEGLIGAVGEKALVAAMESSKGRYGTVEVDPHGHLRLGEIEFGRMIKDLLDERLKPLKLSTTFIDKDLGYELRCADPIPFDIEYTRDLGYGAVKFLRSDESSKYGAIISFIQGRMEPLPFEQMLDPRTKRMQTRVVDVKGEGYECARRYMTRLEKADFQSDAATSRLAQTVGISNDEFRKRFGYLAE